MEKFYFEIPGISRKEDAIDYIREFLEYGSEINGAGRLHRFLDDYEGWLKKLDLDYIQVPNEERVPARTYFLVRESDSGSATMADISDTASGRRNGERDTTTSTCTWA